MTLLGKIFTVLIFIMSLVFMAFAVVVYGTHYNWKKVVLNPPSTDAEHDPAYDVGTKFQIQDAAKTIQELHKQIDEIKNRLAQEQAARRMVIAQLQSDLRNKVVELEDANKNLDAETAKANDALAALREAQGDVTQLAEANKTLRADVKLARENRDAVYLQVVALTDALNANQGTLATLTERRDQLAQQVADRQKVLDEFGLTVHSADERNPPPLDGYVTTVSDKVKDFIEISLGTDDGLRVGHELDVFRNRSYLGRVVVRKVSTNYAVAEIIFLKSQIKKNDSVTTKLNS